MMSLTSEAIPMTRLLLPAALLLLVPQAATALPVMPFTDTKTFAELTAATRTRRPARNSTG